MQKLLKNKNGFSLAELLVAMIIMLLIITTVTTIFSLNQKTFIKANTKAELLQNARIASDVMAREVRQAREIVTVLPPDNSNPSLVAHELKFEDGHVESQIQYIRYYLSGNQLIRETSAYYFDTDPDNYVHWNDLNQFGLPAQKVLDERAIGEFFANMDFYGNSTIHIDLTIEKNNEQIKIGNEIKPRNI